MNGHMPNGQDHGSEVNDVIELFDRTGVSEDFSDDEDKDEEIEQPPEPGTEEAMEFGKFVPPLYRQRYSYAYDVLNSPQWCQVMSRIVDLGTSECKFLRLLKNLPRAREVVGVDMDLEVLEENQNCMEPLFVDFLHPRKETPLELFLMQGSVEHCDNRLKQVDAVTAIELIEHLSDDALEQFPSTVFSHMKPKIVILTTPNREYNVLFEDFEGPFRHWDHKFEWSRQEFQHWVQSKILDKYNDYVLERFDGVGEGPENIGHCSQIAVLMRHDFRESALNGHFDNIALDEDDATASQRYFINANEPLAIETPYKIVAHFQYPMRRETRTRATIIFDEANFHIYRLAQESEEWENHETAHIDVAQLLDCSGLAEQNTQQNELCDILQEHGFTIAHSSSDRSFVDVPFPEEESEAESESDVIEVEIVAPEEDESWE